MKVVYIAHPISGDIEGNLEKIKQIGRKINLEEPDVIPFAHYFFDCHSLDDDIPEERERGIKNDIALMKKGFIDEVRLYGDRISSGMQHEIDLANQLGIPIIAMTKETKFSIQMMDLKKANEELKVERMHKEELLIYLNSLPEDQRLKHPLKHYDKIWIPAPKYQIYTIIKNDNKDKRD